ncbi:MAG: site-2 protease family protein [Defluviitaleaceae bacterium]|nr:site-2 protease family protein [Defluviitaleaceae bacterium]
MSITLIISDLIASIIIVTLKEFSVALLSNIQGDNLPKSKGKLSLNPFKHIEIIGLIMLILTSGFGWGKGVDTNKMFYKNRKIGTLITYLSPSIILILFAYLVNFINTTLVVTNFIVINSTMMRIATFINFAMMRLTFLSISFAIYNLLPIYPLDGSKVLPLFLSPNKAVSYIAFQKQILVIFMIIIFLFPRNPVSNFIGTLTMSIINIFFYGF